MSLTADRKARKWFDGYGSKLKSWGQPRVFVFGSIYRLVPCWYHFVEPQPDEGEPQETASSSSKGSGLEVVMSSQFRG